MGVDIGGTFTDCVCLGEDGVFWAKSPTSAENPVPGVMSGLEELARTIGVSLGDLLRAADTFVHGCTIGTNAVIERSGARVALLITRGHEDTIRIGRLFQKVAGLSESEILHTSRLKRPRPLVERNLTFGIHERLDRNGSVIVPLNERQVEAIAIQLKEQRVEAVAICYLWSFLNPAHESRTKDILEATASGMHITLSSEIAPVIGEYERAVASVLNAYVGPSLRQYLEPLEKRLQDAGYPNRLQVFDSGGGVMSVRAALKAGVRTIDSGPVGGVVGARQLSRQTGLPNLICADMGGTSFDVSIIRDGRFEEDLAPTIDQYTFRIPRVAVKSIGAGGGSIAWVDDAGVLRVGPRSARSIPGPACYGRGGTQPTVTDADVVLGMLNREALLGGRMPIDAKAACQALAGLATRFGSDVEGLAAAIVNLINAQMADLVRRTTLERGYDPREFTLVMYGGAGPAHGIAIARDVGCASVLFPDLASTFAARGMASCDIFFAAEKSRPLRSPFTSWMEDEARRILVGLADQVALEYASDGYPRWQITYRQQVFVKYQRQASELAIDVDVRDFENGFASVADRFRRMYQQTYGVGAVADFAGLEISTFRVEGRLARDLKPSGRAGESAVDLKPVTSRRVRFPERRDWLEVPVAQVYGSFMSAAGQEVVGPLIVERYGETIVVPPGCRGRVQDNGSLLVESQSRG